jgi:hypothetical protein
MGVVRQQRSLTEWLVPGVFAAAAAVRRAARTWTLTVVCGLIAIACVVGAIRTGDAFNWLTGAFTACALAIVEHPFWVWNKAPPRDDGLDATDPRSSLYATDPPWSLPSRRLEGSRVERGVVMFEDASIKPAALAASGPSTPVDRATGIASALVVAAIICSPLIWWAAGESFSDSPTVPPAKYAAIHTGQTVGQVEAILGGGPDTSWSISSNDPGFGQTCIDYSAGSTSSAVTNYEFCFHGGRLMSKSAS